MRRRPDSRIIESDEETALRLAREGVSAAAVEAALAERRKRQAEAQARYDADRGGLSRADRAAVRAGD